MAWPSLSLVRCLSVTLLAAAALPALTQPELQPAPTRGQMLYATHCIECHNSQVHWRARQQARDWSTLRAEVYRWQAVGVLGWSDADIDEVTRHLNDTIYQFPQPRPSADARVTVALPSPRSLHAAPRP